MNFIKKTFLLVKVPTFVFFFMFIDVLWEILLVLLFAFKKASQEKMFCSNHQHRNFQIIFFSSRFLVEFSEVKFEKKTFETSDRKSCLQIFFGGMKLLFFSIFFFFWGQQESPDKPPVFYWRRSLLIFTEDEASWFYGRRSLLIFYYLKQTRAKKAV